MKSDSKQLQLWWWVAYYKHLRNHVFKISTIQRFFVWHFKLKYVMRKYANQRIKEKT